MAKAVKKAKKSVRQFERAAKKDLKQDVKETGSVIDAAFENVSSTHKGTKKRLSRYNRNQIEKIMTMNDRMRAAGKRDVERVKRREGDFGTMGGMLSQSYTRSERNARAGNKVGKAVADSGNRLMNNLDETSRVALGMMKAGADEAEAGAEQAMHDAAAVRARQDAETAAQMRHQIALQQIAHQQALEMQRREHENALKLMRVQERAAESALEGAGGIGPAKQQITVATSVAQELYERMQEGESPDDILKDLVERGLLDATDVQSGVVRYLARTFQQEQGKGADAEHMAREVMAALEMMPAFASLSKKQKDRLRAYVKANVTALKVRPREEEEDDGGFWDAVKEGALGGASTGGWDALREGSRGMLGMP